MEIFSENPRSFKMDRKSPEASKLKDSIARKLFDFLGNYSDDVLAEYIAVLVCNGKHQNQAREDLEAFLGDESRAFVAWLWSHLAENFNPSTSSDSPNLKSTVTSVCNDDAMGKKWRTSRSRDLQNQTTVQSDKPLSNEKKELMLSTLLSKAISENPIEGSEDYQRLHLGSGSPLTEVNTEEVQACGNETPENRSDNCKEAIEFEHSRVRCSLGISAGDEQCLQYEDRYKKIANNNYNGTPQQLLHSPKRTVILGKLQSAVTENPRARLTSTTNVAGMSISSRAVGAVTEHITNSRGNVWDRLGRPREGDAVVTDAKIFSHNEASNMKKFEHKRENFGKHSSMIVVPDGRLNRRLIGGNDAFYHISDKAVSNNHSSERRELELSIDPLCSPNVTSISGQKRKLGEIFPRDGSEILLNCRGSNFKDEGSSPVEHCCPPGMDGAASDTRRSMLSESAHHLVKSPKTVLSSRPPKISRPQLNVEAPVATIQAPVSASISLPAKSALITYSESGHANSKPIQAEVLDVKLRLRQIEIEMTKLRSKQTEAKNDSKPNLQLSSSTQNLSEDDNESRTVFVTNVHYGATKEALLSHFSKCGMIIRVKLLYDTVTAQPKGSAYILFASKESADKALSMSGTSFFSRTLKVVRKADVLFEVSSPPQPTGKPLQQCPTPPYERRSVDCDYWNVLLNSGQVAVSVMMMLL
ncbi:hypothetical protein MRB53_017762 [Persea americana]|uniref:Uncharacterized protein n=1 Tax=Persea americana TaxID=3435 RepID=A0ACC2M6I2_PERAE|nr:hypothetical protein MRB53_017762 [Persea americana]